MRAGTHRCHVTMLPWPGVGNVVIYKTWYIYNVWQLKFANVENFLRKNLEIAN